MDSNSYPYKPLRGGEIRYLVIHAFDEYIGVIQCSLYHAPLHESDDSFTALSYVWGNVCETDTIQLNGQSFSVTTNLRECLRQFAINPKYRNMRLWVDAVCINQQDTDERNAQIQRMREIYSNAELVIAWLGPGTRLSSVGLQRLQIITLDEVKSMGVSTEQDVVERRSHIWSEILAGDGEQGLHEIVLRAYWHRTWIVQEILLGKRVRLVCGADEVSFEWLQALQRFLTRSLPRYVISIIKEEHQQAIIRLAIDSNIGCMGIALVHTSQGLLLERLSKFASFQCSDDKDKVYALLGLCHDAQHIVPDYNNPTIKVYGDVVEAHIKTYDNVQFLKYVEYDGERDSACPSWMPDWRGPLARKYVGLEPEAERPFHASKRLSLSSGPWSLDRNTEKLHLTGACLDTITILSSPFDLNGLTSDEHVNAAVDFMHLVYQTLTQQGKIDPGSAPFNPDDSHVPRYPLNDNEPLGIACRRTLVADYGGIFARGNVLQSPFMMLFPGDEGQPRSDGSLYTHADTVGELYFSLQSRRLAITSKGWIGLVPKPTEPGDQVSVLVGANLPYILRKAPVDNVPGQQKKVSEATLGTSEEFLVIGGAYIHGLMHGRGLDLAEMGNITLR